MKDFIDREGFVEEWQERQIAAEFAIMQLASIVKGLCLVSGGKEVWDGVIETWAPKTVTDAPNVVPLRAGISMSHQRRINSLTAGLLEGRHPLEVLANLPPAGG